MVYTVVAIYFGVLALIGLLAGRRVRSLSDYYVGGKRLGYWVVAFSARATGESAWLYLGLTGLGAVVGLPALWVVVGELAGVAGGWFLMARPFKAATDRLDALTIPDYLVGRFAAGPGAARSATVLRLIAAIALAGFGTIYVSAQIDATGKAFASFLEWDYYAGSLVGFTIVAVYASWGGFLAVAWSDLVQGLLMLVGLMLLPIAAVVSLGGLDATGAALTRLEPAMLSVWGPGGVTWLNLLSIISYAAIGLGFLGSPQVFVRFMAIRGEFDIRRGRWVAIVFTLLTDTGAVLAGLFGRALLVDADGGLTAALGSGGELVLPLLTRELFPPLIVGLYVAAVLAATMSTIDSLLIVASSAVTHDVYQRMWHSAGSSRVLTRLSRQVTLVLGLFALAIAWAVSLVAPDRTIFWYVIFGWSGLAATFCPMMILSLLWRRYNVYGAVASMVSGIVAIPVFAFAVPLVPRWGPVLARAEELAPSFAVSLVAGIVVTVVTRQTDVGTT